MNGVDKSDQILSTQNLLRNCVQWWKTLFFHLIEIATGNSFIIFQECQKAEPNIKGLQRPANYSLLSFREELVRNILELEEYSNSPVYRNFKQKDLWLFSTQYTYQYFQRQSIIVKCVMHKQRKNTNCCHTVVQHSEMCIYIVTVKKIVSKHSILEIIINDLHL